jgi:hypothetical protein
VLALVWFKVGLLTGHSYVKPEELVPSRTLAPEAESIPVA